MNKLSTAVGNLFYFYVSHDETVTFILKKDEQNIDLTRISDQLLTSLRIPCTMRKIGAMISEL